jgi:hypothetical protein
MAKLIRRVTGALLLLLGALGLALSLAGMVGCWLVRPPLTQKASQVCERSEKLLGITAESAGKIKATLEKARANLAHVRKESAAPPPPDKLPAMLRATLRRKARDLSPQIEQARQIAGNVVDFAAVLSPLLEGLNDLPFGPVGELDPEQVNDISKRVTALGGAAQKLDAMLGELPGQQASLDEVSEHAARMDEQLSEAAARVGALADRAARARARVAEVHSQLPDWITGAAVVLTVVLFWIALGQLSLLVHGWSWCRGPRA